MVPLQPHIPKESPDRHTSAAASCLQALTLRPFGLLDFRIDDRFNGHCFGMFLDTFDCKPGVREPESLGATPHEFVVEGVLFYVDPHNEIALSPQCTAMTVRA